METNLKNSIELEKINFFRCSEVDIDLAFQAFSIGFSDYMVKFEYSKEQFVNVFFGAEGNKLEHSFVAIHENEAVGVILGGIKTYENIKTMRCGTLAISPDYRGVGVSQKLIELHKEEAVKNGCKQLFLEVIVGNDRAINFYKKLGYEKIYDLSYFSKSDLTNLQQLQRQANAEINKVDFHHFKETFNKWDFHINWQNDIDYLEKLTNFSYYLAKVNNENIGALAINANGRISFLMVDKAYRHQKIATNLLQYAATELNLKAISTSIPNNNSLEGFMNKLEFKREKIAQYEMYKLI
ncbi:GNAT family N-acetyltransferase [Bacillus sp. AFS002410]|uniref:GNAT family N-acetyltransferase n=1 Tax=Bacillus sp. AFS002410 TaxID=2033481 RepID=UPI000BEFE247|nr:GNAT family N-acetyltransferase [Bacillus sp. AFS002410]PEJ59933.1 GNAT family N-acetyltransferase [Bacillus sp. AFS002410]